MSSWYSEKLEAIERSEWEAKCWLVVTLECPQAHLTGPLSLSTRAIFPFHRKRQFLLDHHFPLFNLYFKLPYILTHRSFVNISQFPFLIGVITILLLFPLWSQLSFRCICKRNVPSNTLNLNRIYIPVNIYIWFIQTWINQILCWYRYYWVTSTFFTTPLKMIGKNNTSCFPSMIHDVQ